MKIIDAKVEQFKARANLGGVVPINLTYQLIVLNGGEAAHLTISDAGNNFKNLAVAMNLGEKVNSSTLIDDIPDAGVVINEQNADNFTGDYTQEMSSRIIQKVGIK